MFPRHTGRPFGRLAGGDAGPHMRAGDDTRMVGTDGVVC